MVFGPPARDIEYALAHELLAKDGLQLEILEALVGQPHRYSDFKPLLGDRNDEVLTKALKALRAKGLVKPGLDLATRQKSYALSNLGRLTILKVHEMVPTHLSIEAYKRGQDAASRVSA